MTESAPAGVPRHRQLAWHLVLAGFFFLFACLYRFNTLDGRFGGFDNDHFVPFAYAKQVQAGELPLRDFEGLGLQGARPSLTYELSALGQRWLGDNLRSEAVLTVAGVGLAAALTFLAAASVSTIFWAAMATPVSIFVAPTLYNYPKVLMLAAAALVIVRYCRRPGRGVLVIASALTVIAFLFRHDLAVYVAVGIVIACLTAGGRPRRIRDVVTYAAVTLALVAPSLAIVQRDAGLVRYFRDGLALSQREAERTNLSRWPQFTLADDSGTPVSSATFFDVEQNGVAWLYYVLRLLPLAALAFVWSTRSYADPRHVRYAVVALAGMSAFAAPLLIRGNVAVRLGDIGPLFAVLAAFVGHETMRWRPDDRVGWKIGRSVALLVLVGGTALSVPTVGFVRDQLGTAGLRHSWPATASRFQQVWTRLASLPDAAIAEAVPVSPLDISQYLNRCTMPADRVVMMTYEPELLPFASRLFGAGRLSIMPDYALDTRQEQALVARWREQSVPLALVEFEEFWDPSSAKAPVVRAYLLEHYTPSGSVAVRDDRFLRVFAERGRTPVSAFGPARLPCFR